MNKSPLILMVFLALTSCIAEKTERSPSASNTVTIAGYKSCVSRITADDLSESFFNSPSFGTPYLMCNWEQGPDGRNYSTVIWLDLSNDCKSKIPAGVPQASISDTYFLENCSNPEFFREPQDYAHTEENLLRLCYQKNSGEFTDFELGAFSQVSREYGVPIRYVLMEDANVTLYMSEDFSPFSLDELLRSKIDGLEGGLCQNE